MENTTCGVPVSEQEEETRKGPWTLEEDMQLIQYINAHDEGRWSFLAKAAGLKRSGKSCRLRWVNYLRPDLKHDKITPEEERLIIELHACWGNRWSRIAQSLPGRTDNEIKNYWRTHITKKVPQDDQRNTIDSNQRFEHSMCSSWMPDSCERSIWQEKTFALSTSFPVTDNMSIYRKNIPSIEDPPGKDGPNEIKPTSFPSGQIDISINNQSEQQPDTFRLDDDGQETSLQQHNWKGSHDLFSNTLPPNFSVNSLTAMLSEFYADDTVDACKISNCSYMGSPESFSDAESSWNAYYSDVLWNMDNDEDRFLHGQPLDRSGSHSAISHDHHVRD